jgi:hypothetical protein
MSTPKRSAPLGDGQDNEKDKVAVRNVVGMMRYFHRISGALINRLDCDEDNESVPNEGPQHPPVVSGSVHRELEKVKFLEFMGSIDGLAIEVWLDNMAIFFALRNYNSNMKVCMVVF